MAKPEYGDGHAALDAARTLVTIAKVSRAAGQCAQAKSMMAYALRTIRSTLGESHPDVAAVLNSMSTLCLEVSEGLGAKEQKELLREAKEYAQEALAIADECVTEADLAAAEARRTLGRIALVEARVAEAARHFAAAAEVMHKMYGSDALQLCDVLEDLAQCQLRLHFEAHGFRGSRKLRAAAEAAAPAAAAAPAGESPAPAAPSADVGGEGGGEGAGEGAGGGGLRLPEIGANPSAVGGGCDAGGTDEGGGGRSRVAHSEAGGRGRVAPPPIEAKDGGSDNDQSESNDDDDDDESIEEQGARVLLERSLAIRALRQGQDHFDYGLCVIKLAEYYWLADDYARVLELYTEAIALLSANSVYTERSKTVAQLYAYSMHCHALLGNMPGAIKANDKALTLCKQVFGDVAWELYRAMLDKVWLIQRSWDTSLGPSSNEGRKAYSLAERWETHAAIMHTTLANDKIDDCSIGLSAFASLKRELVLRPEDDPEGASAKQRANRKARRDAKNGSSRYREPRAGAGSPALKPPAAAQKNRMRGGAPSPARKR